MPAIGIDCYAMLSQTNQPIDRVLDSVLRDPRVRWHNHLTANKVARRTAKACRAQRCR